jgi:hypothetical protein
VKFTFTTRSRYQLREMPREVNLGLPIAQPGALARSVEFGVKFTTGVSTSADARCLPFSAEIHLADGNIWQTGIRSDLAQMSVRSGPNEMPGSTNSGYNAVRQPLDGFRA